MPDHRARATNRSWLRPAISLREPRAAKPRRCEPRAHAARRPLGSNIRRPVQICGTKERDNCGIQGVGYAPRFIQTPFVLDRDRVARLPFAPGDFTGTAPAQ